MQQPLRDLELSDLRRSASAPVSRPPTADGPGEVLALIQKLRECALSDLQLALDTADVVIAMADEVGVEELRTQARTVTASVLCLANRFEDSLRCLSGAEGWANQARSRAELASAAVQPNARLGRLDAALQCALEAVRCFDPARHRVEAGRARTNLGVIYRMRSDPKRALVEFDAALTLIDDAMMVAQIRSNRAEALLELAQFDEAEAAFHEVASTFARLGARRAAAIACGNLADLLGRSGRFQAALEQFETAIAFLSDNIAPGDLARLAAEKAEVLVAAGRFRFARSILEDTVRRLRGLGMIGESLRAETCLVEVLMELGLADQAREHVGRALGEAQRASMPLIEGRLRIASARLHSANWNYRAARLDLARALVLLRDQPLECTAAQIEDARVALACGQVHEARSMVMSVRDALNEGPRHPVLQMQLAKVAAAIAGAEGNLGHAMASLTEAIEVVERTRSAFSHHDLRVGWLGRHLDAYYELLSTLIDRGPATMAEAFRVAESARCRSLLEEIHGGADLLDRIERGREGVALDEHRAALEVAAARRSSALRGDAGAGEPARVMAAARLRRSTRFRELFGEPATLEEVQAALPEDATLIEFVPKGSALHAMVVDRHRARTIACAMTVDDARELIDRIRFDAERWLIRPRPRPAMDAGTARRYRLLFDGLVAPWIGVVETSRIIIVPHGPVHAAPLHAAQDGRGQPLIARVDVTWAPSASLVAAGSGSNDSRRALLRPVIVSVGDAAAPEVEHEAAEVAALFDAPHCLGGASATAAAVREALGGSSIVHFACHARFDMDDPLSSGLRVADGWLMASDLYGLRVTGSLVTLAACEAGRTGVERGNEMYGLIRPFLAAGAEAVLAPQWRVDDSFSTGFMRDLYRHIIDGRRGVEALALTQRAAWQQGVHPALWANFMAVSSR